MQIVFGNVAIRVHPSWGGIHFKILWLSLLYASGSLLHRFLGRIGNALSLLSAGPGEGGCRELLVQGDSDKAVSPGLRQGGPGPHRCRPPRRGAGAGQGRAAWQDHPVAFVPGLLSRGLPEESGRNVRVRRDVLPSRGPPPGVLTCCSRRGLYMTTEYLLGGKCVPSAPAPAPPDVLVCSLPRRRQSESDMASPTEFRANIVKGVQMALKKNLLSPLSP